MDSTSINWDSLVTDVDSSLCDIAVRAGVSSDVLRSRYVVASVQVRQPTSTAKVLSQPIDEETETKPKSPVQKSTTVEVIPEKPKYSCDIEAALAGDISDSDESEQTMFKLMEVKERRKGSAAFIGNVHRPALISAEVQRVLCYPQQRLLAENASHKVFVTHREANNFYFRLANGAKPMCFDAVYTDIGRLDALHAIELRPGTPCIVLAQFDPRETTNDYRPREHKKFTTWARAAVESVNKMTMKVRVRLVDFGRVLDGLYQNDVKPLPVPFDGQPLAYRCVVDKSAKLKLPMSLTMAALRVASSNDKSITWCKTWKVTDWKELREVVKSVRTPAETPMSSCSDLNSHLSIQELTASSRDYIRMWLAEPKMTTNAAP